MKDDEQARKAAAEWEKKKDIPTPASLAAEITRDGQTTRFPVVFRIIQEAMKREGGTAAEIIQELERAGINLPSQPQALKAITEKLTLMLSQKKPGGPPPAGGGIILG